MPTLNCEMELVFILIDQLVSVHIMSSGGKSSCSFPQRLFSVFLKLNSIFSFHIQ